MKKRYLIIGYAEITFQPLLNILKNIFDSPKLKERFASDVERTVVFKNIDIDLYVYEGDENRFMLEIEFLGLLVDVQNFVENIADKLAKSSSDFYQFEWSEVDKNDDVIGIEYEIKSEN